MAGIISDGARMSGGRKKTHAGNLPLQRAIYSFLIFPSLNSADSALAVLLDNPRTISPEVNLSKRFTASRNDGFSAQRKWCDQIVNPLYIFSYPNSFLRISTSVCRKYLPAAWTGYSVRSVWVGPPRNDPQCSQACQ